MWKKALYVLQELWLEILDLHINESTVCRHLAALERLTSVLPSITIAMPLDSLPTQAGGSCESAGQARHFSPY